MTEDLKKKIKSLPNSSGIYIFKNNSERIIYVGKANSIKKRVNSHFQRIFEDKQQAMINEINDIDYIITKSSVEALILENNLIKLYHPYYNIKMRDDKNYPYIKLTNEEFPRLHIARKIIDDKAIYFGPYVSASSMRQTIRVLRQVFGIRSCHIKHSHRPYSGYLIGKCTDACVGKISKEDYAKQVLKVVDFLSSKSQKIIRELNTEMHQASENQEYEKAKILRDQIATLNRIKYQPEQFSFDEKIEEAEKRLNFTALDQLKKELNLLTRPKRIECFDISNLGVTNIVGSMIVFQDGSPDKSQYRKFKIETVKIQNDVASMKEMLDRRFSRSNTSKVKWPLPDLILLDGGKGQLSAGKSILKKYNLNLAIAAMAKKFEYLFIPNKKEVIILPRLSPALSLLQRARDEAHRFAITYQKNLRKPKSILEEIPGIGPKRRQLLLQKFGSVENIKVASAEDIAKATSISLPKAQDLLSKLKR